MESPDRLTFSVVVPTHDRPVSLRRTVKAMLAQKRTPEELIIVNDGSEEIPTDLADEIRRSDVKYTPIRRPAREANLPASRNAGMDAASGEIIVMLDDDIEPDKDYLVELEKMYLADKVGHVDAIGAVAAEAPRNRLGQRIWDVLMWFIAHTQWRPRRCVSRSVSLPEKLRRRLRATDFIVGGRASFRRRLGNNVRYNESFGGYALGEDRDFSYRAAQKYALFIAPSLKMTHHRGDVAPGRPDPVAYGKMIVSNIYNIAADALEPGAGKWLLVWWNLFGLFVIHVLYLPVGDKRTHAGIIRGMAGGAMSLAAEKIKAAV